jgi:hypothetical protein
MTAFLRISKPDRKIKFPDYPDPFLSQISVFSVFSVAKGNLNFS